METKMSVTRRMMLAGIAVCAFGFEGPAQAQTSLKVMVFPSLVNLPIYVADRKGFYTERGLAVEVLHTPNSDVLRNGLAKGDHQIVHAAVDNAVAMAEVAKSTSSFFLAAMAGGIAYSCGLRSSHTMRYVARPSGSMLQTLLMPCCFTRCST